jgi:hypothetical protein
VERIHTAPAYGRATVSRAHVRGTPGRGLDGDRYAVPARDEPPSRRLRGDLTLIEVEVVEGVEAELGLPISPGELRRNITTSGINLNALVARRFRVGEVLCEGLELCEPCAYLQELVGKPVLKPLVHRGGLRAAILAGGQILVPGRDEMLRVNGRATITSDAALLEPSAVKGQVPDVGIVIDVEEVFFHCAASLKRSGAWEPPRWPDVSGLASLGTMLKQQAPRAMQRTTPEELDEEQDAWNREAPERG